MHPPGAETVLVRHGEIGVKSAQVQHSMEGQLRDNIAALLADRSISGEVVADHGRLYVHTDATDADGGGAVIEAPTDADGGDAVIEAATDAATDAFGVVSASPALAVEPTVDAICDALGAAAREHYDGGTFAVDARRAGEPEDHDFTSRDLQEEGGAAVWRAAEDCGYEPAVDLDDPDHTFSVEARPERAFVFREKRQGPGGLPVGTQAPLVALVSGGIDSPVAAWEAMCRGSPIYPLYVDLGDYGGPDHRARATATVEALEQYAPNLDLDLRVAPGGDGVDLLVAEMDEYRMLSFRRFMFAIAEHVARDLGAAGIVTGEAIGQKSSQTAANLRVTTAVTDFPIHRPLLTMDKATVTERAREIGTFDDATIPAGCNRVAPSLPATAADGAAVRAAEPDELLSLAREAAAAVSVTESPASEV